MNPQEVFLEMLVAAMKDAVCEGKLTQLQTQIQSPKDRRLEVVRIIVIPEKLQHTWPLGAPAGTPKN